MFDKVKIELVKFESINSVATGGATTEEGEDDFDFGSGS